MNTPSVSWWEGKTKGWPYWQRIKTFKVGLLMTAYVSSISLLFYFAPPAVIILVLNIISYILISRLVYLYVKNS